MDVKIKPDLCRVCLSNQDLLPIFNDFNDLSKCNKIVACAAVHVEDNDPLPAFICRLCNQVLELAYIFKTKCEDTDRELRQLVEVGIQRKNSLNTPSSVHIEVANCEPIFSNIQINIVNHQPYYPSGEASVESIEALPNEEPTLYQSVPEENEIVQLEKESLSIPQSIDEEILNVLTETGSLKSVPSSRSENNEPYPLEVISPTEAVKTYLHFPSNKSDAKNHKNASNDMYYNDDIELGEECEVITDGVASLEKNEKEQTTTPRGRFVVIKSIVKPENIRYVPLENIQNKNDLIPIRPSDNTLRKVYEIDDEGTFKNDVPEPASYIETETETENAHNETYFQPIENNIIEEKCINFLPTNEVEVDEKCVSFLPPSENSENKNIILYKTYISKKDDEKPKRGRIKKIDKSKPPHGVSYLKSGRKIVSNVIKKSKTLHVPKMIEGNNQTSRTKKIIRRARVEKISTWDETNNLQGETNRMLSTSLLNSDKHYKQLNNPQKQVLIQRMKLENLRPTSKKDIIERGIPDPLPLTELDKPRTKKSAQKHSLSNDLAIINGSNKSISKFYQDKQLQSIDQDLKVINNSLNNLDKSNSAITVPAKTGRHTAIKSKTPMKRNRVEAQPIDFDLESSTRKSERQRSPKKIFPEIDVFATQKRKADARVQRSEESDGQLEEDRKTEDYVKSVLLKDKVKLDYGTGLSCNVCNKSFPYRSHLIRHVRTHTGVKPHLCQYCQKTFSSLSSLNIHVKNHLGDFTYVCEVCQKGFVQPSVLKRHMLSHTGEHPFQCEICYRTFVHDSSLKLHLKMHTIKEPQHKCDICEKKFKYLSTLTSHKKTHSGIKPFTCSECRKAFYRRSLLKRHMRSHTNERPYKCRYCKARFAYSGGLASHQKLHTGIRPYRCELCSFSFFRKSHLANHMDKIHNNGTAMECCECNVKFESLQLWRDHWSQVHGKVEPEAMVDN